MRITKKDCENAVQELANAMGREAYDHEKHRGDHVGKIELGESADYSGKRSVYYIKDYPGMGSGYFQYGDNTRRMGREFIEWIGSMTGGIVEGRRLAALDTAEKESKARQLVDDELRAKRVLEDDRRAAADSAWEDYDIGDCLIEQTDGWERVGNEWTKKVYVGDPDDPDGDSIANTFGVTFGPDTAEIITSELYGS